MVNSTSPNSYQLLLFRTLCYNVTFLGKQLVRVKKSISKTEVKRGMAISHVMTVSSPSGKAQNYKNLGFYISTFKGHRDTTHIVSANII